MSVWYLWGVGEVLTDRVLRHMEWNENVGVEWIVRVVHVVRLQ